MAAVKRWQRRTEKVDESGALEAFCSRCALYETVDEHGRCEFCGEETGQIPLSDGRVKAMRQRLAERQAKGKRCEACEGLPHRRLSPRCPVCDQPPGAELDRQPRGALLSSSARDWRLG